VQQAPAFFAIKRKRKSTHPFATFKIQFEATLALMFQTRLSLVPIREERFFLHLLIRKRMSI